MSKGKLLEDKRVWAKVRRLETEPLARIERDFSSPSMPPRDSFDSFDSFAIFLHRGTCAVPAAADLSPQLAEAQAALANSTNRLQEAKQAGTVVPEVSIGAGSFAEIQRTRHMHTPAIAYPPWTIHTQRMICTTRINNFHKATCMVDHRMDDHGSCECKSRVAGRS